MDTHGWDIVSSLSLAVANQQLLQNTALTGAAFNFQYHPIATTTVAVAGHFASWQLVSGGSGQKVHLAVALQDGSLTTITATGSVTPVNLAGVVVTIEVPLGFVTTADGVGQELRFYFSTAGAVASQSTVTAVGITLPPGSALDSFTSSMVEEAIVECVYNNADSAGHVFATLIPNPLGLLPSAPQGGTQFFDPTTGTFNGQVLQPAGMPDDVFYYGYNLPVIGAYSFTYTVSAGSTGTDYLTICSQAKITGDPTPATTSDIDPGLVDFSSPACLGFSARYFLKYVLMPQLPAAYGLKPGGMGPYGRYHQSPDIGRFSYQNNQVTNTDTIGLPSVSVNGTSYDVQINHITFSIVGTQLHTQLDGESDITSGVSVQFSYSSLNTASLNAAGQLVFAPDPNPQTDHSLSMSATAKFENVLSLDTFNAISNAVGDSIAHSTYNNLDSFGVSQLSPSFVQWTDYSLDTLTAVGLNAVFYAHGTGKFVPPAPKINPGGIIPLNNGGIHFPGGLTPTKLGG